MKEEKEKEKEIIWTDKQNEIIGNMIRESEDIGYVQGYDDAIKDFIKELEEKVFELKKRIYRRENLEK